MNDKLNEEEDEGASGDTFQIESEDPEYPCQSLPDGYMVDWGDLICDLCGKGRSLECGPWYAVCCGQPRLLCVCSPPRLKRKLAGKANKRARKQQTGHVHRMCGLWSSGAHYGKGSHHFSITNLQKEVNRGSNLTCRACGKRGATLGCRVATCRFSFHYPCAITRGLRMGEGANVPVACDKHFHVESICPKAKQSSGPPEIVGVAIQQCRKRERCQRAAKGVNDLTVAEKRLAAESSEQSVASEGEAKEGISRPGDSSMDAVEGKGSRTFQGQLAVEKMPAGVVDGLARGTRAWSDSLAQAKDERQELGPDCNVQTPAVKVIDDAAWAARADGSDEKKQQLEGPPAARCHKPNCNLDPWDWTCKPPSPEHPEGVHSLPRGATPEAILVRPKDHPQEAHNRKAAASLACSSPSPVGAPWIVESNKRAFGKSQDADLAILPPLEDFEFAGANVRGDDAIWIVPSEVEDDSCKLGSWVGRLKEAGIPWDYISDLEMGDGVTRFDDGQEQAKLGIGVVGNHLLEERSKRRHSSSGTVQEGEAHGSVNSSSWEESSRDTPDYQHARPCLPFSLSTTPGGGNEAFWKCKQPRGLPEHVQMCRKRRAVRDAEANEFGGSVGKQLCLATACSAPLARANICRKKADQQETLCPRSPAVRSLGAAFSTAFNSIIVHGNPLYDVQAEVMKLLEVGELKAQHGHGLRSTAAASQSRDVTPNSALPLGKKRMNGRGTDADEDEVTEMVQLRHQNPRSQPRRRMAAQTAPRNIQQSVAPALHRRRSFLSTVVNTPHVAPWARHVLPRKKAKARLRENVGRQPQQARAKRNGRLRKGTVPSVPLPDDPPLYMGHNLLTPDLSNGQEPVPVPVTNDVDDEGFPSITYITNYKYMPGIPLGSLAPGCSGCPQDSDDPRNPVSCHAAYIICPIQQLSTIELRQQDWREDWQGESMCGRLSYNSSGRLLLSQDHGHKSVVECNARCPCESDCSNRQLQKGLRTRLEVFKTRHKGWGVRTLQRILRGAFVTAYVGEVLTFKEAEIRGKEQDKKHLSCLFDIDPPGCDRSEMLVIDGFSYSNVARFINHSCKGNLSVFRVYVDTLDPRHARLGMYAVLDIEAGEELSYDYFYAVPDSQEDIRKDDAIVCQCGETACRGLLWNG